MEKYIIEEIENLSLEDSIVVLDFLKDKLGLVSQKEYKEITEYPYSRQNLVLDMKKGKIKSWLLGGIHYPILNNS